MWFDNMNTIAQIKHKYRELVKIYHPDNINTGDIEKFRQIQEEYDKLIVNTSELPYLCYYVDVTCDDILKGKMIKINDQYSIILPKIAKKKKIRTYIDTKDGYDEVIVNIKDYPKHLNKLIFYVTLNELKEHKKIEGTLINGKKYSFTIPFKCGKMISQIGRLNIELRIKDEQTTNN